MSQIVNGIKGQVVTAGSQYALKKVSGILRDIVSPQPKPKTGIDSPDQFFIYLSSLFKVFVILREKADIR